MPQVECHGELQGAKLGTFVKGCDLGFEKGMCEGRSFFIQGEEEGAFQIEETA